MKLITNRDRLKLITDREHYITTFQVCNDLEWAIVRIVALSELEWFDDILPKQNDNLPN